MLLLLIQCNNNPDNLSVTAKFHSNDPFQTTMSPSQNFPIDAKRDNIIAGTKGTVVVCPKGCFKDSKGEIVTGSVNIELAEALSLEDMILSNLTTTSNGQLLETGGMIYINATANGEQLSINKENPIHIEIPTANKKSGMMAYKGRRNEKGDMNWIEPKDLDNFLVTIDIGLLDFLPTGFQAAVDGGMPFRKYQSATQELTDSLYYSLSVSTGGEYLAGLVGTNYNEAYYNRNKKVENGKYTEESYHVETIDTSNTSTRYSPEIDPAIISVIKSSKFQNTFIATREFEARLKLIFKTCQNSILEIYINNIDKNLYQADSMAAKAINKSEYSDDFERYYQQRLTNVKDANKYATLLKGYYQEQLSKVKMSLEQTKEKYLGLLDKKNQEAQQLADRYKELLWKREKFRMETYSFTWTDNGWINIDVGIIPKDWGPQPLQIFVENGKQFDRVYTYVVYTSISSLYRLNTDDMVEFYVGNDQEKKMLMPKKKAAICVAIGYKGEDPSLAIKEFETGEPRLALVLSASSLEKIKEAINPFEAYRTENRISEDLEYMAKFFQEQQRQKVLINESEFITGLARIAFPCMKADSSEANK